MIIRRLFLFSVGTFLWASNRTFQPLRFHSKLTIKLLRLQHMHEGVLTKPFFDAEWYSSNKHCSFHFSISLFWIFPQYSGLKIQGIHGNFLFHPRLSHRGFFFPKSDHCWLLPTLPPMPIIQHVWKSIPRCLKVISKIRHVWTTLCHLQQYWGAEVVSPLFWTSLKQAALSPWFANCTLVKRQQHVPWNAQRKRKNLQVSVVLWLETGTKTAFPRANPSFAFFVCMWCFQQPFTRLFHIYKNG